MTRMLAVALCAMFAVAVVGCGEDHHMPWDSKKATTQPASSSASSSSAMTAAHDDCPMCPGVQTARADGTCPKCGAKVKG